MPEEILQCYDVTGTPTESRPRSEVKQEPYRWWYGVVCVWLVNSAGELLCSKRSAKLNYMPDRWQTYFGGHVTAGETFELAALRELEEETGLRVDLSDLSLIEQGAKTDRMCHYRCYAVRCDLPISKLTFAQDEISDARWIRMQDYWQDRESHPENWCNECPPARQERIHEWLPKIQ